MRGQGASGWALASRRSLVNGNGALDFEGKLLRRLDALKNLTVFPLLLGHENLGCLSFYSEKGMVFSDDDAQLMEALVPRICEAINNARRFQKTLANSLTDALTGLPNSRYWHSLADQALGKCAKAGAPLALLAMDLDGFKEINDTYGHHVGDHALRQIAQMLRSVTRETDTVIRYAGDEFIVTMPGANSQQAQIYVQRLHEAAADIRLRTKGLERVRLGISVGSSCFPEDGDSMAELLVRADRRMYEDKRLRRHLASGVSHDAEAKADPLLRLVAGPS